jgi:hypothetical protein
MRKLNKKFQPYLLPIFLILVLSFSRLIPHPSNFTPILAAGIFTGFYFRNFILSLFIVIFSMFFADLFLGFHNTMFFTYSSLIIAVIIGLFIKELKFTTILFSGLVSSISFFIITNFGAWLTLEMYEKDFSGLLQSYIMGIPFFHNTLISTFLYLIILKFLFNTAVKKKLFKIII